VGVVSILEGADLTTKWQRRFDKEFPHGLSLSRDYGRPEASSVPVAWVRVRAMAGLDPVVTIWPPGDDRMPWSGLRLLTVTEMQTSPVRLVRVTYEGGEHAMLWTAVLRKEPLAGKLAPWRAYYQARARGESVEMPE
jgi:hypothetical protein